jgi:hypothetical protein
MTTNQNKPTFLTNPKSSYKKLEKEMNKPPSDYNAIKSLVENNDIENMTSKNTKQNLPKALPHQKNNIKSKNKNKI